jgi:hypothetical protein
VEFYQLGKLVITTYPGIELQIPRSSPSSLAGVKLFSGVDIYEIEGNRAS